MGVLGQLVFVLYIEIQGPRLFHILTLGVSKLLVFSLNMREQWNRHTFFLINLNYKWVIHITSTRVPLQKVAKMALQRCTKDSEMKFSSWTIAFQEHFHPTAGNRNSRQLIILLSQNETTSLYLFITKVWEILHSWKKKKDVSLSTAY